MKDRFLRQKAAALLSKPISSVEKIDGGANSTLFRVKDTEGRDHALKFYKNDANRNRCHAEVSALRYLSDCTALHVPDVVNVVETDRVSLLEWIDGITPVDMSDDFMAQFVDFQLASDAKKAFAESYEILQAAEACTSPRAIITQAKSKLKNLENQGASERELSDFLKNDVMPYFAAAEQKCRHGYAKLKLDFDAPIPRVLQTLIASDFGLHNSLLTAENKLYFIDFEYFGWDDPITAIANFVMHPGMTISDHHKDIFKNRMLAHYENSQPILERFNRLMPLFMLRWLGIILSDFVYDRWSRKQVNKLSSQATWEEAKKLQLEKAINLFAQIEVEFK